MSTVSADAAWRHWAQSGLSEHSSVGGFSKVILGLLSIGAPYEIVRAAQDAATDEIKHAKLCFGLANRLRKEAAREDDRVRDTMIGPGPLPLPSNTLSIRNTVVDVACATAKEGCVEETVSAFLAAVALDLILASASPREDVVEVLRQIVNDEGRHASLAWYTVRWCVRQKPNISDRLESSFQRAIEDYSSSGIDRSAETLPGYGDLVPFGILGDSGDAIVADVVTTHVIAPWVDALLKNVRPLPEPAFDDVARELSRRFLGRRDDVRWTTVRNAVNSIRHAVSSGRLLRPKEKTRKPRSSPTRLDDAKVVDMYSSDVASIGARLLRDLYARCEDSEEHVKETKKTKDGGIHRVVSTRIQRAHHRHRSGCGCQEDDDRVFSFLFKK